ncbi:HAMP domain-containing sensor histidine kinase [Gracilibacillus sp. S3-1-1]|uniref:HAMP domain-containing sensor histidine kinase n=1 Tax=Gracilibacillus pellucidus TaxID=3095368 RepID=A0ACC6M5S9_9BACI|nr:HAMP domain-containing sensor histidine kinase [Gracilibacillus sp. S3-1-1]MDX8046329.1 HAMP domain-containing sensor histidine kinase [Gracilibacillus sp. S3-1-1]
MKLQHQITIAFTTLLVIIMTITGILIYSQLLQMLIQNEQRQLEDKGGLIVDFILTEGLNDTRSVQRFFQLLEQYNLQVFVYDENDDRIVLSSLSDVDMIDDWTQEYNLNSRIQPVWQGDGDRYVVSIIPIVSPHSTQHLVLLTPLDNLQEVQKNLVNRLFLIFVIGILVTILISHYLTATLVTPLTKLRHQLKKIEKRKFDEMEEVKAAGEIKQVEQSVVEMANELNSYIQSQQQFFQNASHELKTPLMAIQGYAEGIRDGVFEGDDADRGFEVMIAEIKRLKKIINEIILLAKLDSETDIYKVEKVNSKVFMKQVVERAIPIANEKNIEVLEHPVDEIEISFDGEKMLQAVMNIVSNAIRHANTEIEIAAFVKAKQFHIEITDNGSGIDEELMKKLFHRFVKGESGETGLGLAIARAIVERSGGVIKASNTTEGGARFTMIFTEFKKINA